MFGTFFGKFRRRRDPPVSAGRTPIYGFELLASNPVEMDERRMFDELRAELGEIDRVGHGHSYQYALREFPVVLADGEVPAQLVIFPGALKGHNWIGTDAFLQSWQLTDTENRVAACPYGFFMSDLMSSLLDHRQRRRNLATALRSVVRHSNAELIYAMPTTQFLDAKDVLARLSSPDERPNPVYGFVNVRFYRISETEGDIIMDTLGLTALGLTDLQIQYRGLEPSAVAALLESVARYLCEYGDVIADGHTIQGLSSDQRWRCQYEMSLLEPKRIVIDVNPEPEFAAGTRADE
jgi:Domain of unknown function (DUF4261)